MFPVFDDDTQFYAVLWMLAFAFGMTPVLILALRGDCASRWFLRTYFSYPGSQ